MKKSPVSVAILCGGQGKRIRSLTKKIPKALIHVYGKPILAHILDAYLRQHQRKFIFCVGYKGQQIVRFVGKYKNIEATISDRGEEASMLQRIHALRAYVEEDLFVTYGDTFTDVNIKKIVDSHRRSGKWMTILTARIKSPYGLVDFDDRGVALSFHEKPILNYYIGLFIMNIRAFDSISKNMLEMKDGQGLVSLFNHLMGIGQLNVYQHERMILTFNTQEERQDVSKKMRQFYSYNEGR